MGKAFTQVTMIEGRSLSLECPPCHCPSQGVDRPPRRNDELGSGNGSRTGYAPLPTSRPTPVVGGAPGWSGTVPCGSRFLAGLGAGWSPAQVAGRLALDEGRQIISHESIYRFIYAQMARKDYSWRHYLHSGLARRGFRGRRGRQACHIPGPDRPYWLECPPQPAPPCRDPPTAPPLAIGRGTG